MNIYIVIRNRLRKQKINSIYKFVCITFPWLLNCILMCSMTPVAVIVVCLRPIILIRFLPLSIGRIGDMYSGCQYLSGFYEAKQKKSVIDILYFHKREMPRICNNYWKRLWRRLLRVSSFGFVWKKVDAILNIIYKNNNPHRINLPPYVDYCKNNDARYKPVFPIANNIIRFTQLELRNGRKALESFGLNPDEPFICFHNRDSSYLSKQNKIDFSHHDYRDFAVQDYEQAIGALAKQGYPCFRMGSVQETGFQLDDINVFDYSNDARRTEFLDIYLGGKCHFFISSDSGISIIPEVFGRPVVYVNWSILSHIVACGGYGVVILKKYYSSIENRLLTYKEVVSSGLGVFCKHDQYKSAGVSLLNNTPEEIHDAAQEMKMSLSRSWVESSEDRDLQAKFWDNIGLKRRENIRIGTSFLRKNINLIEQ